MSKTKIKIATFLFLYKLLDILTFEMYLKASISVFFNYTYFCT